MSLERLGRLESSWSALAAAPDDRDTARILHREAHTLKGDSRVVGFTDVNLVCHKLEDLLEIARARAYRVGDDFSGSVVSAIRFMAVLIHKRVGEEAGVIDLPDFVTQMDRVIADARRARAAATSGPPAYGRAPNRPPDHGGLDVRAKLSRPALDVFVESVVGNRPHLYSVWLAMRDVVELPPREAVAPRLDYHRDAARVIARDLGKQVVVRFEIADAEAAPDVADLLDTTVLHLVRNAIDHGVERPGARINAGKPGIATVTVSLVGDGARLVLTIEDDGHGVDFDRVRTKGLSMGLLDPSSASRATPRELGGLLFHPGFSTRIVATDVSGRGIGLDAVGAAIVAAGGSIGVDSEQGRGTRWTVAIPNPPPHVSATVFRGLAGDVPIAVASEWNAVAAAPSSDAIDPLAALGAAPTPIPTDAVALRLSRGDTTVVVLARKPLHAATAVPILAFPAEAPATVAVIDGVEGLLVRPDRLAR